MASSRWSFLLNFRNKVFPGLFDIPKCVGQDSRGNKYFEVAKPKHRRKVHRYYEPACQLDGNSDLIELTKIPPAWESWLKFRRQEPPSEEEIRESQEYEEMWKKKKEQEEEKDKFGGEPKANFGRKS